MSRLASSAAVGRYESDRHTAVINLLHTRNDRRTEEESRGVELTTAQYGQEEEEEYDDDEYYDEEEYDDGMSGDYELEIPRGRNWTVTKTRFHTCFHSCCLH